MGANIEGFLGPSRESLLKLEIIGVLVVVMARRHSRVLKEEVGNLAECGGEVEDVVA